MKQAREHQHLCSLPTISHLQDSQSKLLRLPESPRSPAVRPRVRRASSSMHLKVPSIAWSLTEDSAIITSGHTILGSKKGWHIQLPGEHNQKSSELSVYLDISIGRTSHRWPLVRILYQATNDDISTSSVHARYGTALGWRHGPHYGIVIIGQKLNSTRFSGHGTAWRRFYESSYRRASWIKYLLRARLMYLSIYPLTSHNINWLGFPDIYKKSESHQHDISQIIVFHCRFHPIFTVETGVFESKIKPITTWRGYLILSLLV